MINSFMHLSGYLRMLGVATNKWVAEVLLTSSTVFW